MHDAFDGADVVVLLAFVPAALAGDDGASCRDANFLNALNIFNSFLCALKYLSSILIIFD